MNDAWELISNVTQVIGMVLIPILAWTLHTVIAHSKQLILLEEKVNNSLNSRLMNLESKFDVLEEKIEVKMDKIEDSVKECQFQILTALKTKDDV